MGIFGSSCVSVVARTGTQLLEISGDVGVQINLYYIAVFGNSQTLFDAALQVLPEV